MAIGTGEDGAQAVDDVEAEQQGNAEAVALDPRAAAGGWSRPDR